jgi:uncharacterized cupin superfamily protein
MNLRDLELQPIDGAPPGHAFAARSLTHELGATRTGLGVYEVAPGQKTWPYHFELGEEEWIVVIEGTIVLRTPSGEEQLTAGDVVCCRVGPDGAHAVRNDSDAPARFMMLSNVAVDADGAVYPDSGTFVVRTEGWSHRGRLGEPVPYWEGET